MVKYLCPCCGRHCYLDEPQCERGIEYVKTGVIPPRKQHKDGNRKPSEQKKLYRAMNQNDKLKYNLQEMSRTLETVPLEDAFACLREEDRVDLLMLLEKIRHDWRHRLNDKQEKG